MRYEKNPLRILDCKNEDCQKILEKDEVEALKDVVPESNFNIINTNILNGKNHMDLKNFENLRNIRKSSKNL